MAHATPQILLPAQTATPCATPVMLRAASTAMQSATPAMHPRAWIATGYTCINNTCRAVTCSDSSDCDAGYYCTGTSPEQYCTRASWLAPVVSY